MIYVVIASLAYVVGASSLSWHVYRVWGRDTSLVFWSVSMLAMSLVFLGSTLSNASRGSL